MDGYRKVLLPVAEPTRAGELGISGTTAPYVLRYHDGAKVIDLSALVAAPQIEPYPFAVTGALSVQTGKSRVYLEHAYSIESVRASVDTAPAGASIIVDVNLNGTSIYSTQANRPTIGAGANTALGGAPGSTSVAQGQYLTVDVDQVGSTTPGAHLVVVIRLRRV